MKKQIVLNCTLQETRVAILEGNHLAEIHIERLRDRGVVGNVYKARVQRVLPGMQAAFVDVGFDKAAFLHASDFLEGLEGLPALGGEAGEVLAANGELEGGVELELSSVVAPGGEGAETPVETAPAVETLAAGADPGEAAAEAADPLEAADGEEPAPGDGPLEGDGTDGATAADPDAAGDGDGEDAAAVARRRQRVPIETALEKGQEILVQVSKEPMGTKGCRVTSYVSLAGRYLVFMPTTNHIGVSRRIADPEERARLKEIVTAVRPPEGGGFIVRTVCEGLSKKEIQADVQYLTRQWQRILRKSEQATAPALLHQDLDQVQRTVRDLFGSDVGRLVVDSPHEHQRILDLLDTLAPRLKPRVELHEGLEPVFDRFGIEAQIDKALERKVWLRSGGYLVIERTEALTAIDVNTGRYVGKTKNQEETILKTNLEAAEEVVRQLRLRNIGGLIIIDFIDMEKAANRRQVSDALAEAVRARDKAQTKILKISELGLVEMTRKRTRESLEQLLCAPCACCEGTGQAKSAETVAYEILRRLQEPGRFGPEATRVLVKASPAVATFLSESESRILDHLEREIGKKIIVKAQEGFRQARYEVVPG